MSRHRRNPTWTRLAAAVLSTALVAAALIAAFGSSTHYRYLEADFTSTDSLYAGADVKILGVPIGTVTAIHQAGAFVRVEIKYNAAHPLPASAGAVIVQPSIVGDRYIQLVPAYAGGAQLANHAVLDTHRTAVPVSLDQTYGQLDKLAAALGPSGANKHGALSDLLTVTANNLNGNGTKINNTVTDLAAAAATLSNNRGDLTATIDHLATFSSALADDDPQVQALATNLAAVSTELNGERGNLNAAIQDLGPALSQVATFVHSNKNLITSAVGGLTDVTSAVTAQRTNLEKILNVLPLGVTDLYHTYAPQNWDPANPTVPLDARTGGIQARADLLNGLAVQLAGTVNGVCAQIPVALQGVTAPVCATLGTAANSAGGILNGLLGDLVGGKLLSASAPGSLAALLQVTK